MNTAPYANGSPSRLRYLSNTPTERLFQSMPFLAHSQRSPVNLPNWSNRDVSPAGSSPNMDRRLSPRIVSPRDGAVARGLQDLELEESRAIEQRSREENRRQSQLHAYIAWVNSQLRKRPGCRQVEELRHDMQDGVALVQLIEIIAQEKFLGVHLNPQNTLEMRENVEKVLQFMVSHRIRMHQINAKEIVDGNLKAIMRLILALAAHYKPGSVKQSAHQQFRSPRASPMASMAQGAAAALAEIRRDAASVGQKIRRPKQFPGDNVPRYYGSSSEQLSDSDQSSVSRGRAMPRLRDQDSIDGASANSSPSNSAQHSPRGSISLSMVRSRSDFNVHQEDLAHQAMENEAERKKKESLLQELMDSHIDLDEEIAATKKTVMLLQELLLSGRSHDGADEEEGDVPFEGSTPSEQLIVLRSRLQQTTELCNDLRDELNKSKKEVMQLQGTKAGLQQRLTEQENSLLQMKAELLRIGFSQESLEAERNDLQKKIHEKDKIALEQRKELTQKDRIIEELKADLHLQMQEKDAATRTLRTQLHDLHDSLQRVGQNESALSSRISSHDKKMSQLEDRLSLALPTEPRPPATGAQNGAEEELNHVRDSLRTIRGGYHGSHPQQKAIDTLERNISSLLDRLQLNEGSRPHGDTGRLSVDRNHRVPGHQSVHSDGDSSTVYKPCTKVLYFTDQSDTPFMRSIHKRLGEITLADFKNLFDKPGRYRYHFKALDPEFGTVKEEITCDEDILPGWEGKIVSWIEEEHG